MSKTWLRVKDLFSFSLRIEKQFFVKSNRILFKKQEDGGTAKFKAAFCVLRRVRKLLLKKIIISVIAAVLVLATVVTVVASVINRQNEIKKAQEEYEQAQNADNSQDTKDPADTTSPDTDIPPVIIPDDTGDETVKDDLILDVTDKDRDPNPGVKEATIEYGTKEGNENAE